ncbi:YncE family protein [Comamonas flocculans]|uniref:YncE family protein n=1 Tax=Comamonas flocculans TaxID=2597701 RepID=A0A5B8RRR8_9BURK|nr:YncE family protein [Comamonas flocculans]QEA12246.1 YncE family protein [Comamonas flocculans]
MPAPAFPAAPAWSRRSFLASGLALAAAGPAPAQATAPRTPVLVLNSQSGSVSVIDPGRWVEERRIATGREPHHLYMTPDERSVIVANAGSDSLTFIDPRTAQVQRQISGILDPYHLRFSPDMRWFVTAANRLNHIDLYHWDGENPALVQRIPTGRTPSHLWIDAASTTLWASMQDSDELVAIDLATQRLSYRVPTGRTPADVFGTPDGRHLLVGLTGASGVQVFELAAGQQARAVGEIATGKGAHAFRALGDARHVLVSNRVANTISQIDCSALRAVAQFPAPSGPDCMDVSRDGSLIMVGSRWAGRLTLIDVARRAVLTQVKVGKSPHGVWTLDHAARS